MIGVYSHCSVAICQYANVPLCHYANTCKIQRGACYIAAVAEFLSKVSLCLSFDVLTFSTLRYFLAFTHSIFNCFRIHLISTGNFQIKKESVSLLSWWVSAFWRARCIDRCYITLHTTAATLHYIALSYITLRCTTLHMFLTTVHCISLHYITLSCSSRHCATFHYPALHYTALRCTILHYPALYYAPLYCTLLRYTSLRCTTSYYSTLHYPAQHYTALHYATLHYPALHYTTVHYVYHSMFWHFQPIRDFLAFIHSIFNCFKIHSIFTGNFQIKKESVSLLSWW
jgi:hypothetical protein